MNTLTIGKSDSNENVSLDLLTLVDTRALIQASSGGGKSWLLRLIAEQSNEKVQTIILDPEGEYATLREKFDMVLVGEGGEIPAEIKSARLLARKLLETGVSAIIDLYDLPDAWDGRRDYAANFIEALMNAPKNLRHPVLIIIDEAHMFCPERDNAESRKPIISLMSAGRKRGFAGLLATQRVSKLHKDAIAECKNVFVGCTNLDNDQERAGDMLGISKSERIALRSLQPGEFYSFGPALTLKGVSRFHTAQVKTTHPKAGQRHILEVPPASKAVQNIVKHFGDLPTQAQESIDELDSLRRENERLQRDLRARPVQVKPQIERVVEKIEVPIFKDGEVKRLEAAVAQLNEFHTQFTPQFTASVQEVGSALRAAASRPTPRMIAPAVTASAVTPRVRDLVTITDVPRPQQNILDALAWLESIGITQADRNQAAFLADQSPTSSGYSNNLGALRTTGLISYPSSGTLTLTESGRAKANAPKSPATTAELHHAVLSRLPRPKSEILKCLLDIYPHDISKEVLAGEAGQSASSSGYSNNLGSLRSLGLIDYPAPGRVIAKQVMFLDR